MNASSFAIKRTLENRSTSVSKKGPHDDMLLDSDIRSFPTPGIDDEGRCDIGADVSHHTILDASHTVSNDVSIDKTQTPRGQMPEKETGGPVSFQVLFKIHTHKKVCTLTRRHKARIAEQMPWHIKSHCSEGVLSHPSDGEAWKHFDRCHPPFVVDAPNMTAERNHHRVIQGKSTSRVYESSERLSNLELFKKLCKKNRHEGVNWDARSEKVGVDM
nr:hypothetical protein [Tanacetum cinerariifolium]GFA04292.1 hypothetical protein [Tanacetum cinerariifolium]